MVSLFSKLSARGGFASLPPWAKLGAWWAAVAAAGAAVQAGAWLIGADFQVLAQSGGRGVLLAAAVAVLLAMMSADRRSAAEYGLAVGDDWGWQFGAGLGWGMLLYAAYCAVAELAGAYSLQLEQATARRWAEAFAAGAAAPFVAATQQIIFSGYLLSTLREAHRRATAVAVSSLLFGVLATAGAAAPLALANLRLAAGMALIAALLAALRLRQGDIVLPSGLLAGCILVRRIVRKTQLLTPSGAGGWAWWLAPDGDPRQSPVFWALVLAGLAWTWRSLQRRGEPMPRTDGPALSASFKRVFPFSNLMALAPLDLWIAALADARFRVGVKYLPRLAAILTLSAINTIVTLPERLLAPLLLRRRPVPDPVFIVGVHRSGTTHLHNLLAQDRQWQVPRTFHVLNPHGALLTGWLITPLLGLFMTTRRPMDAVRFSILAPQEDEFALAAMSRLSPYWGATFPRRIPHYDRFIFTSRFSERELRRWSARLLLLLRKLTFWSGRRPLLKSPYHTARVAQLRRLFPRAKFIHIVRHPFAVYRSNLHMARQGWVVFQLQEQDEADGYAARFLDNYRRAEEAFYRDAAELPPEDVVEVRLEDLERDPVGQLRRIYGQLQLPYTIDAHRRFQRYADRVAGYRKNRLPDLTPEQQRRVLQAMGGFLRRWGYAIPADAARREAA